ncbi:hypothetical protein [Edaphobacter flagellatus]|uniref:hypothetical protein n=1 Tax=Edaphobacter flagellatus TaxID=1933044 RepID=UPI0021B262B0|nr:hypothetical protein [Edaphobacter flagellatus]
MFLCLVFQFICFGTFSALAQQHVVYPTVPPPPHTPQEILLLFTGNTADERILLTLNNNRPNTLKAMITVFTSSGVSTSLPDVDLVPQESKLIELSPVLKAAGLSHQELGWLKIDYSGVRLELGAQLTLYPTSNSPGVDSPRSLSGDFKSVERDAVFWMPERGKAYLALTNSSTGNIDVKMKCGPLSDEFVIPSKTTTIRRVELHDASIVHVGRFPVSCDMTSDGAIDALRPVGTVIADGYSAPIRFYDPKTATFPSLTAVGLDPSAETHVTVHNVSDAPVDITPIVREAALSNPLTKNLATQTLAPHESREVSIGDSLSSFRAAGISRVTLTLKTLSPNGSIVGSVTQISLSDHLVEDIPLRTSNPPAFARGSYPLRWDEDYTNLVTVTNTADETLRIGGQITAGDTTYVFKRTDIEPGATIVFDVDKWKKDAVPDVNGKVIPQDAKYGKFHWIEMSNGKKAGLLGRTSLSSVANRRKSSFSCGSTCEYNFTKHPYFDPTVFALMGVGDNAAIGATEFDSMLNGNNYHYPADVPNGDVWADSSVVGFALGSPNITEAANSLGTTNVTYNFYDAEFSYDPDYETCNENDLPSQPTGASTVGARLDLEISSCQNNGGTFRLTGGWGNTSNPANACRLSDSKDLPNAYGGSCGQIAGGVWCFNSNADSNGKSYSYCTSGPRYADKPDSTCTRFVDKGYPFTTTAITP